MKKYVVKMKKDNSENYRWFYAIDNPDKKTIDKMLATFDENKAGRYRKDKAERIREHFHSVYPKAVIEICICGC